MVRPNRSISDAELTILKALWSLSEATVKELIAELAVLGHSWAYTTVQTLLSRMQEKGYVTARRTRKSGRAFVFKAICSRQDLLSHHLDELAERVCEGQATPLVLSLVQGACFGPDEIRRFRAMLDELEKKVPSSKENGEAS